MPFLYHKDDDNRYYYIGGDRCWSDTGLDERICEATGFYCRVDSRTSCGAGFICLRCRKACSCFGNIDRYCPDIGICSYLGGGAVRFCIGCLFLTKALDAVRLGWLNRWLGSGLGALKYMILIGLAIHVLEYIDPKDEMIDATKKQESVLYYSIRDLSGIFFPVFKNVTEQLIEI